MIKITKNNWRAFIELHVMKIEGEGYVDSGDVLYFDVTKRPIMVQQAEGNTAMIFSDTTAVVVKESMKEILKAVDKLIKEEQEKQADMYKAQAEALKENFENGKGTGN